MAGSATPGDGGERLMLGDAQIVVRASAESTGGIFAVFEELPPLLDTSMHVHANEDEFYYVLEGEHVFQCGDETFQLGPGGLAFLPRGIAHGHRRLVPGTGRLLTVTTPAGLEGFFRELADAGRAGGLAAAYPAVSERYGITWVSGG